MKGSRFITHNKSLANLGSALSNFLAAGVLDLGYKLGPVLWQLPANMTYDRDRVDAFLSALPRDLERGAVLARRHDDRVESPSSGPGGTHRIRHVLEGYNLD